MDAKIPATVITGFLGSGKTTIIQNLLAQANGKKIALIINEFGELGVDKEILKGCRGNDCPKDSIIELTNGCICCTVADDFVPAITQLLSCVRPDHIIIETSGLAIPQPLVDAFNWPEIRESVIVDGVITIVDSAAVAAGRFAENEKRVQELREADDALNHENSLAELFEDQINCADMIILNKTDLIDKESIDKVCDTIKKYSQKSVKMIYSRNAKLPIELVLGLNANTQNNMNILKSNHVHAEDHNHDDFVNIPILLGNITNVKSFLGNLQEIIEAHNILRLKGFVNVTGKSMRLLIQAVGKRVDSYFDRQWYDDESRQSSLVIIGMHDMDTEVISKSIKNLAE